jgi:hypothetical protein
MLTDAKQAILARRARFIAAALAAAGVSAQGGCAKQPEPQACLSPEVMVEHPPDAGDPVDEADAALPSSRDPSEAGAASEPVRKHLPRSCLSEF